MNTIKFLSGAVLCAAVGMMQIPARGQAAAPQYGTEYGYAILQQQCYACHGSVKMPQVSTIAALMNQENTPEKNLQSLKTMAVHKDLKLTEDQLLHAAESLSGRMMGTATDGDAKDMKNHCAANPPISDPGASASWNGWGNDVANTRFQQAKAAGISADQVPKLRVKWAFGFPHATAAHAQPAVVAGRVFVGSNAGWVYSLDANTGCVYWSYKLKAMTRDAFSFGPVKGHPGTTYGVFVGDLRGFAYGLDAQTGKELWVTRADDHFTSRVTGAPTLYEGKLFVPIASWEGFNAKQPEYPCCTSRGSVVALDANTGKQIWKFYTMSDPPKQIGKNSMGTPLYGPSGVSVWNAPTIDAKLHAVLFGTGEAAVGPVPKTSDAIAAVDINTGKLLWAYQTQSNDVYLVNCPATNKPENCPENGGPDWDIGNSPILKTLANGKRVVIAGTKNGNIFAVDPDQKGALLWNVNAKPGNGGYVWGGAADDQNVYFGDTAGGVAAVKIATGERSWVNPLPAPAGRNRSGNAAAVTVIDGVVFSGSVNGIMYGLSTKDGKVLWQFDTAKDFTTVNGVAASGNMMSSGGPVVSGGMMFIGSGYSFGSAIGRGNVLLALAPE